jgi:calcineurin-like phosphoesterase family protein
MSKNIWVISDHHFNHKNIIKFTGLDGKLMRPGFDNIDHMNQHMVEMHNSVVKPGDKVYFGGDFGDPEFANLLVGQKRIIVGNHDNQVHKFVGKFKKIMAWRRFRIDEDEIDFVITHFPILLGGPSIPNRRNIEFNVHGHIHEKVVLTPKGEQDLRYVNICVEQLNYTPMHIDDLAVNLRKRKKWLENYKQEA